MRQTILGLAALMFAFGFVFSELWVAAAVLGVLALFARPGGLLGIGRGAARTCPYCKTEIPGDATRCRACREEVAPTVKRCASCGAANRLEDRSCLRCSGAI